MSADDTGLIVLVLAIIVVFIAAKIGWLNKND